MALNFIEDLSISGNVGLPDDSQVQLGSLSGGDMKLYYVSGIGSYVLNKTDHLRIINQANDKDIIFETDDGSGSTTPYITLDGSTTLTQFDKDTKHSDTIKATFGAGADLQIYHDGTESNYVTVTAGDLYLRNESDSQQTYIQATNSSGTTENYIKLDGAQEYTQFDKPARMMDNVYLQFGNSNDSDIYHNGTDMFIRNYSDDGKIRFYCDDGSGGVEEYFYLDGSGGGSQPFTVWPDSAVAVWGNGHDLRIEHDGTYSTIDNYTGDFEITNYHDDGDLSLRSDNGSGGTKTYLRLDGGVVSMISYTDLLFGDALYLKFGDSQDLTIRHTGSASEILNYTGNLEITQHADDGDIIFASDDGSGGTATYMYLDGGNTRVQFNKDARFVDAAKILIGTGDDGQIYSSSDNLYIDQTTADKDIIFRADAGDGSTATYFYLDGSLVDGSSVKGATRFPDASKIYMGTDGDMEIFHNGSQAYIENYTSTMNFTNHANDADMNFKCDNGSGGTEVYFYLDGSLADGSYNYTRWNDGGVISLGTGMDLRLWHDPSTAHGYIRNYTNDLYIENTADDCDILFRSDDGSGGLETYFYLDGSGTRTIFEKLTRHVDDVYAAFGTDSDLRIYHDGSNSYIKQVTGATGNLIIEQDVDDADIQFLCDNGSGGTATYFRLDGSTVETGFLKPTIHYDSVQARFGDGGDLKIYHDGSNSYIDETGTGSLYIKSAGAIRLQSDTGENMIYAVNDGAVNLYHNNVKTFETTASGIEISGLYFGSGATATSILDEDNMASDSATALATQQSIKAYVDNKVTGVLSYQGTWNANTNTPTLSSGSGTPGYYYIVSVAGSTDLDGITDWAAGDWAVFSDLATDAWQKIDNTTVGDVSVGSGAVSSRVSYWSGTTTIAGTAGFTFDGSNLAVPGNITLGGGITATGDLTVDVTGDINLDASGGDIKLKDDGVSKLTISMQGGGDTYFVNETDNADILFKGVDDTSTITALTLDMSDAGFATFNSGITAGAGVYIPDYIYHTGDTNTYFGFYTSDTIVFRVAGTEAVRIDANGDVGIGTTDPLKKLHIVGPDGVSGSTSGNSDTALLIDNDGSNGAIIELMASNDSKGSIFFTDEDASNRGAITYGHTSDELIFKTAATTAVTIDSSQNTTFAGTIDSGNINISDGTPVLTLTDTSSSATVTHTLDGVDYQIANNGSSGNFKLSRKVSTTERVFLHAHDNGNLILYGNGSTAQTISGANTTFSGNIILDDNDGASPNIQFKNEDNDSWYIYNDSNGKFQVQQSSDIRATFSSGDLEVRTPLKVSAGAISISGDGANYATLTESSDGEFKIASVTDLTLDAGGGDIILSDDTTIFGTFSKSGNDLQLRSRISDGDLILRGVDGGSTIDALTLDMSEAGYATFNDGATFAGTLTIPSYIYHTSDPSDDTYFGFSANDTFVVYTAGGKGIEIDSNRDVTITGELYGPNGTKAIPTYSFTNDTDTGIYLEGTGNIAFTAGGSATLTLESTAVTAKTNIVLDAADIQLDTAVSASTSSGTIIKFGSTVSMSAGQVVYGSNSMGSLVWGATDADTGTKNILGLALGTSPTSDGILLNGIYHSASHGFTVGLPLYISTTGGEMTTTAPSGSGDYVRVVGYAIDANHIYFCPDNTWIEIS